MAQQQDNPRDQADIDIGTFRKIRLKINRQGYWEIWWTDASGGAYLTRRESCRTKDRAQAAAYLDAFLAAARDQQTAVAQARAPDVDELCRRWLDYVTPLGKDQTGRYVLNGVRRFMGGYSVDQLDAPLLQDYGRQRAVQGGTVRRELGALRTVLIWAAKQKLIARDDLPLFDEGVMPQEGSPRTRFLDETQERWFWDQAMQWGEPGRWDHQYKAEAASRIKVFVALGLETAARCEAILDLTWDRVDLARGMIDYQVPGRRITKKRRVRVPISDRLRPVLEEAYRRAPYHVGGRAVGKVIGIGDIHRAFTKFAAALGVPWVTPHVLRHTWGSLKIMRGASLYDISQVMGDTVATLEKHYLHVSPDHLRKVINL